MKKQSEYWAKNVVSWEKGAYYREKHAEGKFRPLDRISMYFRGDSIYTRADHAFELIKDYIPDKIIIDVGCASGRFARRLAKQGAKQVVGIDVSEEGITLAKIITAKENMQDSVSFTIQDVTSENSTLPQADLTLSLGVIEYFDTESSKSFLSNLNSPYFFFSFPLLVINPKGSIVRKILRSIYLKLKSCPGIFYYSTEQFQSMCAEAGISPEPRIINHKGSVFVTNLPIESS